MEQVVTPVRFVLSVAAVALGATALGLAHDVRSWDRAIGRGDARFAREPDSAYWDATGWLPGDAGADVLSLADDLALRRAEQAFAVARAAPAGFDNGRRRAQLRAEAELALSDVVATGSRSQASRAGNLLGILAVTTDGEADAAAGEQRALDTLDAAIRADPTNTDAKYNLELLLRRIRVVGSREGAGGGSGNRGDSRAGAGSGTPGSGY
jgi:hypothetical protein